jgi:dolichol kinase
MIVPLLFAAQFSLIGFGIIRNEPFVNSMSRSGDPRELLRGTLYYAIIMIIAALFFFVTLPLSDDYGPVAIVTLMILAFGDGFADIVGRTMDKMTFIVFSKKSVPGTIAMLIASLVGAFLGLIIFGFDLGDLGLITVIACLVATIVEVASPRETDNFTIPVAVILTFFILTPILLPDVTWELFKVHTP